MNAEKTREDFPILQMKIKGKPFTYFDSACVSLKPRQVVNAMNQYYYEYSACHGRSIHRFGKKTTEEYEAAREKIAKLIGARPNECVFLRNTTEAINLVANSLGLQAGDKVITTNLEHNSNLVPWMMLKQKGVAHEMTLVSKQGEFDLADFENRIDSKTKLVSLIHTSNFLATTTPAEKIAKICHDHGALLMLDAAQSVPHRETSVKKLGADFLAFSGHKMLGPSGTGILYGRRDLLEKMNPFMVGGDTVKNVTTRGPEFEEPPAKFEAGLQNYAGAIGLGTAAQYLTDVGMKNVEKHEQELAKHLMKGFAEFSNIEVYGPRDPEKRCALAAFNVRGIGPHEIAMLLDETANIFIRSGMHCVHVFNQEFLRLKEGSARASLYLYNTASEIDFFFETLRSLARHLA